MNKKNIKIILLIIVLALCVNTLSVYSLELLEKKNDIENNNIQDSGIFSVSYQTHIQDIGWQDYVHDGEISGTHHQSKRLEGIKIKLVNQQYQGDIEYKTHVQDYGWMDYVKNDEMSGTSHESKRLEAIQIRLTGEISEYYDVYYRVHAQNFGWMNWAKNDEMAGSAGFSYRLEAIEIIIVEKGETPPERTDIRTDEPFVKRLISYRTHVQNIGWQDYVHNGEMSGTSGQSKRIEAIQMYLGNLGYSGGVEYNPYIEGIGWQGYVSNNSVAGTSGQSLRLEAIKIRLTGEIAEHYDVYYRVHVENKGWLGWTSNNNISGTIGYDYRLEAIEIQVVEKNSTFPGDTNNSYYQRMIKYKVFKEKNWSNFYYDGENNSINNSIENININLIKSDYSGNILYSTYVHNKGWQNYVNGGTNSNQKNEKIEGIKIKLSGEISNYFDIYYSVYISNEGWTDWAKNDEKCGNIGFENSVQSLKIKLVEKNSIPPGPTQNTYKEEKLKIKYNSYVVNDGWQGYVNEGEISGTTGKSKSLHGIKIKLNKNISGSISYSAHVSNVGWQSFVFDDSPAGVVGNQIEALKIKLTGELENEYDIYYRVHVSTVGWMVWAKNGEITGTTQSGLGIEAIEIKIVEKNNDPPLEYENLRTNSPYLTVRWETDSNGNRYLYDVLGNKITGRGYKIGNTTYYFGPTGIYLGTKNLEVLDISAHNGNVDWKAVSESGIYGVILRVAASSIYRDSKLKENVEGCKKYGIPYGIYIYSYAENYTEGVEYAQFTQSLISEFSMNPTLGIFLDLESNPITQYMNTTHYTAVVKGFLSVIPNAELYTYTYYANTSLNTSYMRNRITWIADYRGKCYYEGSYKMWQYTSEGRNAGINGDVDRSVLYN